MSLFNKIIATNYSASILHTYLKIEQAQWEQDKWLSVILAKYCDFQNNNSSVHQPFMTVVSHELKHHSAAGEQPWAWGAEAHIQLT